MKAWKNLLREEGSFPVLAIIMIGLLIFTGLAFMKWGADESWEARLQKHKLQAYYAAHAGVMDRGYAFLRTMTPNTLVSGLTLNLGQEQVINAQNQLVATADVSILPVSLNSGGTGLADFNYISVRSVGKVDFQDTENQTHTVRDTTKMVVKLLNVSNFLYLTNIETTVFGELIKFWYLDTLDGWVHSNDTIALQGGGYPGGPVFFDHVSTTAPIFTYVGTVTPYFAYPPMFNYREIQLPTTAEDIRNAAASSGTFFTDGGQGQYKFRLIFSPQGWKMFRVEFGQAFNDTAAAFATGGPPSWKAIFVDGYLELKGIVRGTVSVGAHGCNNPAAIGYHCIRLMDDIRYSQADAYGNFDSTATDMLGIVSEKDIVIANSPANGQDNGWNVWAHDPAHSSIVIDAAMVALGESFTFEDQNDTYNWEYSTGYVGPSPDRRGEIWLHGAVTQYRRGYVHRSTHGDTGYGKHYYYDPRLNTTAPPYFIQATDATGHAVYQIMSWGNR